MLANQLKIEDLIELAALNCESQPVVGRCYSALLVKAGIPKQDTPCKEGGGSLAQWLGYLLLDPAAPGSIPGNVAEVYQQHCVEHSVT